VYKPLIPGGYILLSRKLIESEIMAKPPLYLKVWVWLLLTVQHEEYKNLNRGELVTTIAKVCDAVSWRVGYRVEKPSCKQVRAVFDWLRRTHERDYERATNGSMVGTTKVTHGFKVSISNYVFYQTPKNYEGHNERDYERATNGQRTDSDGHNIYNKNDKNKEIKNKENTKSSSEPDKVPVTEQVKFDFDTGSFTGISEKILQKWYTAFPAVDVDNSIDRAGLWLIANPKKRKKNYFRFLTNWMSKGQERGGSAKSVSADEAKRKQVIKNLTEKYDAV